MTLSPKNKARRTLRKALRVEQTQHQLAYRPLTIAEQAVEPMSLRDAISNVIDSARINANDTVLLEEAVPADQWSAIFVGSIQSILACDPHPQAVIDFFAANGITF